MQYPATRSQRHAGTIRILRGTAALALIASGLLGACSSASGDKTATAGSEQPKASATDSPTGSATGKASGKASGKATSSAKGSATGSVSGDGVGARSDLQGFSCDAKSGVWSASGKVVNSTKMSAKYTVDIAVASVKTSTVVGRASKALTVESGKTVSFTVPDVAKQKGDGLACTPHVTRVDG